MNSHRMQDVRDQADLRAGRYDELFARYWGTIRSSVRSVGLWREVDVQDAMQMTAERLFKEWRRGKQYSAPLRIIIVMTSRWMARDVKQGMAIEVTRSAPVALLDNHAATDAFADLETVDWMEVMELRYLAGMPPGHVAEHLGIEPNAENQAHFRAIRALRLAEAA
jgi:DNA-directed RNA polymerase specialized sigma24 family protein